MDPADLRRRFAASPVASLATIGPDGRPHLVPMVFALIGDVIVSAVDAKPKRTLRLQRLIDLEADARCSLLVDHYEEDWSRLWWVRAEGSATIMTAEVAVEAMTALAEKYVQYVETPPPGPVIAIRVTRWSGWSALPDGEVSDRSD